MTSTLPSSPSFVVEHVGDGRQHGELRLGDRRVGKVEVVREPNHLAIVQFVRDADAPADAESILVRWLIDHHPGGPPVRITHAMIQSLDTLGWYQRSPLAPGCIVVGAVYDRSLVYDRIGVLPDPIDERARWAGPWPAWVTVICDAAFETIGGLASLSRPQIGALWRAGDSAWRIAALRALALDNDAPQTLTDDCHHLALIDSSTEVRQFASSQMGGTQTTNPYAPDVARLLASVRDPLAVLERFGRPVGDGFELSQARRNGRFAMLFSLGNLIARTVAPGAPAYAVAAPSLLATHLHHELESWTPARDQRLYELAVAELSDAPDARFGIGVDASVGLLDLMRYAVHRYRVLARIGEANRDRFFWLVVSSESICASPASPPRMQGSDDRPLARVVYGPSPRQPMPTSTTLPAHLVGVHPLFETWPAPE